jgi:hypothetical protein
MASVSAHACVRWTERVNPRASVSDAHAAIMSSASIIDIAADFGASTIILGCGARLKLKGDVVATVLGSRHVRRPHPIQISEGN